MPPHTKTHRETHSLHYAHILHTHAPHTCTRTYTLHTYAHTHTTHNSTVGLAQNMGDPGKNLKKANFGIIGKEIFL